MEHRHLNHQRHTLAAIDDVIARGKWDDWAALRRTALGEPVVVEKIQRVCAARLADPYAQRHHFWMHWTRRHAQPDDEGAPAP